MFVKERTTEGDGVFVQKECVIEWFEGMCFWGSMHWLDVKHRCETGHTNTKLVDGTPSSWPCFTVLLYTVYVLRNHQDPHSAVLLDLLHQGVYLPETIPDSSITCVRFRRYCSFRKQEKIRKEKKRHAFLFTSWKDDVVILN